MAEPSGNEFSSSAARALTSRLYSTTGGQTVAMGRSEPTVTQPRSKLVEIARAAK
ncbi:MAG: hypothetical protein OEY05_10280 [Paracoccaceae bacterium]|nr:hypothetical protein [Paracoccaceae bacterium]